MFLWWLVKPVNRWPIAVMAIAMIRMWRNNVISFYGDGTAHTMLIKIPPNCPAANEDFT